MTIQQETQIIAWDGATYQGAGDWYDKFTTDPEFTEYTEDLDADEKLRLAMYAYNGSWGLVPEDLWLLISEEQDSYQGEAESEEEFTRELLEATGTIPEDFPSWVVVDYQATWDRNLRHDYFDYRVIDIDGNYRQFFWLAQ